MDLRTRRNFLTVAGGAALRLSCAAAQTGTAKRLKVIVAGGHPDDPESGCGGTMARYAEMGHTVVAVYVTRGEAGISGKRYEEAARTRSKEVEDACKILGARPLFAGQVDGATELDNSRYESFRKLLLAEEPDVVFTQWPVDTHRDHRVASLLVFDAWQRAPRPFALYYYEVMTGSQTQNFVPTDYVDITSVERKKRDACFAHASQQPEHFYGHHKKMQEWRGFECRVAQAEAFAHYAPSPQAGFPLFRA